MKLFGNPARLFIFDVDGTLLDLLACFQKNLEQATQKMMLETWPIGKYLEGVFAGQIKGEPNFSKLIKKLWYRLKEKEIAIFERHFREEESSNPYPALDGSREIIRWLLKQQVFCALCTNNPLNILIERLLAADFNPMWFAAISTLDCGFAKPDPRMFEPIFQAVPVPKREAVYVGDWYADFEAARAANIEFIAVLSGGIPRHAFLREGVPEDHIIERVSDLQYLMAA